MKWAEQATGEILILGLGNDVLGDDAVGLYAARALRGEATGEIVVAESPGGGLELLDLLEGYDKALILDSVVTGRHAPGTVLEFKPSDFGALRAASPHYAGLPDVMRLAGDLQVPFPKDIRILAVEIVPRHEMRQGLSPEITGTLPEFVAMAEHVLRTWQMEISEAR